MKDPRFTTSTLLPDRRKFLKSQNPISPNYCRHYVIALPERIFACVPSHCVLYVTTWGSLKSLTEDHFSCEFDVEFVVQPLIINFHPLYKWTETILFLFSPSLPLHTFRTLPPSVLIFLIRRFGTLRPWTRCCSRVLCPSWESE